MEAVIADSIILSAAELVAIVVATVVAAMVVSAVAGFSWFKRSNRLMGDLAEQRDAQAREKEQLMEQQLKDSRQLLDELQPELRGLRESNLVLEAEFKAEQKGRAQEVGDLRQRLGDREQQLNTLQSRSAEQLAQLASVNTKLEEQSIDYSERLKDFQEVKKQLNDDFELLANRIFEEKSERFNKNSKVSLDSALNPLREQLTDFKKKVEDVHEKDSRERINLSAELAHLKQLNQTMTTEALNLTKALKGDNKTQGNWGEIILERVLEESGLHKGREYDTQVSLKSSEGQRRNPDVIVRLPENKDIIIDSKVSLVHYERYCNSEDEGERKQALKDHIASVRTHINSLSIKDYENLEGVNSLDFVFIFIPIESAFMAAFEHDQAMFRDAYEKNIIVVSPTTLLATLRTVQSIWRYERQNKNAEEIARQAGAMHDKFVGFIKDLDKISEHLQRASQAHESAMGKLATGKGNLVGSTQRLEKLGAKVKKAIPESVRDADELSQPALHLAETGRDSEIDSEKTVGKGASKAE